MPKPITIITHACDNSKSIDYTPDNNICKFTKLKMLENTLKKKH